ncbi:MAG: disease resistance protein [Mycobacterium sp.]|nr:MAG: disease resistance protein [Mycobacterium sp.]
MPNLREALQFALAAAPPVALQMATRLYRPWTGLGKLQQGRRRIEQALDAEPTATALQRLQAVNAAAELAFLQADIPSLAARQAEARELLAGVTDRNAIANFTVNDATLALLTGQLELAQSLAQESFTGTGEYWVRIFALLVMTWAAAANGDAQTAVAHAEHGLALSEAHGHDIILRTYLWAALALGRMVLGQLESAEQAVREGLQLSRMMNDTVSCVTFVEAAAWIAAARKEAWRAAVLTAAAATISRSVGADSAVSANVGQFHEACEHQIREQLSPSEYRTATNEGRLLSLDEAIAIVLDEAA